jgi:predicted GIY-YIG superfamily endonuclease
VKLVWFDEFPSKHEAFLRERQKKGWSRVKKVALIANNWERIQQIVRSEWQKREKNKSR